jgi:hypothetical protein
MSRAGVYRQQLFFSLVVVAYYYYYDGAVVVVSALAGLLIENLVQAVDWEIAFGARGGVADSPATH